MAATQSYFEKAIDRNGEPETIAVDQSCANPVALEAPNTERSTPVNVQQNNYLNKIIEQDHHAVKRIFKPMMGFKDFRCAHSILSGIETMHMVRHGQMRDDGITVSAEDQFQSYAT